jgi:hypothetical protein
MSSVEEVETPVGKNYNFAVGFCRGCDRRELAQAFSFV